MPRVNDPFERQHIANLSKYAKIIDEIFKAAAKEAASIGVIVGNGNFDASRVFSFADYPITHKMIQSLLSRLANSVETAIVNGVEAEWTLANNKNNELSRRVFGDNVGKLTQEQYRKYFSSNDEAREAFLARKEQGLNLSERVWRYTECFKSDIELGLDIGIRNGLDAAQMSRQLRQFLQHPDMLFRRVRDEHGNLVLSKRASDFHPGRGVYRSSYKNARRLAVTETNMAYRSADYERMQQLDFVVGIEIRLSNNHTTPGKNGLPIPLVDICDELKGKYPKDFKFTSWHPQCKCFVVTILKTEEELMQENAAILEGRDPSKDSVNAVRDVPKNFKDWFAVNEERAKYAKSIPYFIRDNPKYIPKSFAGSIGTLEIRKSPNIIIDAFQSLRKAVYPDYVTDREVKELITDFATANPALFDGGLKGVKISRTANDFMSCERSYYTGSGKRHVANGNTLKITDRTFVFSDGTEWNPLQELKGAISAIRKGEKMTFGQEYAVESLWHEIRHAGANGWADYRQATKTRRNAMECINQFCARRSYVDFVKSLGGVAHYRHEIIMDGYGYTRTLHNFQTIIDELRLDPRSVYAYFKDRIQTTPYESIFDEVAQYVARNGGVSLTRAEQLIANMGSMRERDFFLLITGAI